MRASLGRAGAILLIAGSITSAHADELLVMPYACAMVGGRPLLTPAPQQSHRIIGPREQRSFTACSPVDPGLCRNWTVHRFDVSCEGARVPWTSVVASIEEETTRRAWMEGGRLVVRMPPSWSFEPGDPCARRPSFDDRFGFGRMRRYCAERRAMAPPPIVEMPFGFAPMLGIDGIFVRSSDPPKSASSMPPAPPAVADVPPWAPPKVARAEPVLPPAPQGSAESSGKEGRAAKEKSGPSTAPAKSAGSSEPKTAAAPADKTTKAPPSPPGSAASPGTPLAPKIINRPEAGGPERPEQKEAEPALSAKHKTSDALALQADTKNAAPTSQDRPASSTSGSAVSLFSIVRNPTTGVIAFGGLALVLLAAFGLARRRERPNEVRSARDIGSVSLGGQPRRGKVVPRPSTAVERGRATDAPAPKPAQHAAAAAPEPAAPAAVDRIPQTRAEALQMLGMGVSPDATDAAIKKVVDGLRLSWHPDLAKNEGDRHLREFRIKQINAAWDLIRGKRLERLDS